MDEQFTETQETLLLSHATQEQTETVSEEHLQHAVDNQISQFQTQAQEHITARRWSEAAEIFLHILQLDPHNEQALLGIAHMLDTLNRFESLLDASQRILDSIPYSAHGLAYKARALQKLQRISEATIANDQALLLDTNLGLAWINRSGLQLLQSKVPEALRSAQRALDLVPDDARAWANKGVALLNLNRLAEALETFDHSLTLDAQQLFALQMKGEILCRIGRMREVISLVQQALTSNPTDVTILTQGIQATRALEMYESLKGLAHALVQVAPDNTFAWENYMRSLRGLGQYAEANQILDQLLVLDGSNFRFWTLKADTLYRLERYREAANAAERATRLSPDYPPANRIHDKALRLMYQRKDLRKLH